MFAFLSVTALVGCSVEDNEEPIRVTGVPFDDSQNVADSYAVFMDLVAEATGREVQFFDSSDYGSITEAVISGQVDIAQLSAFSYVLATSRSDDLEILGISTRSPEDEPGYRSYGIIRKDQTDISELSDLEGKTICFSDPASGAGYLWPAKFLNEAGLNPDPLTTDDFEAVFVDTFPQVAIGVQLGDCDAGFLLDVFYDKTLVNSDFVDLDQLDKFWTSTVSPGIPLVINVSGFSEEERASLDLMIREKANKDYLVDQGICEDRANCNYLSDAAWGYVPGEDSFYDELRELCAVLELEQCTKP